LNNHFTTRDIQLATFLHAKNIPLLDVQPIDNFFCEFTFESPPKELIDFWLSNATWERTLISAYRHLVRDSRVALAQKYGGER